MGATLAHRVPSPDVLSPRRMPPVVRRVASSVIHVGRTWVCELGAIGPDDRRGRRFGAFGKGSVIAFPPGAIFNEHFIRIGTDTMIGPYVSLSAGMAPGQQMVSDPVVSIGDRTLIGRGSHIVGHFCVEIGDDIQTGPYVYITDQNHSYEDPDTPIGRQWPVESSVHIGSGSWLGTGVVVLPGSHIGRNVVVGAGSVVAGDLPDHCVAVGAPAVVVKHYEPGEGWRSCDQKLAGSNGLTAPKKKNSAASDATPPSA
jgi:acetyltransferase-like isoleucine patch superfamily enzyme